MEHGLQDKSKSNLKCLVRFDHKTTMKIEYPHNMHSYRFEIYLWYEPMQFFLTWHLIAHPAAVFLFFFCSLSSPFTFLYYAFLPFPTLNQQYIRTIFRWNKNRNRMVAKELSEVFILHVVSWLLKMHACKMGSSKKRDWWNDKKRKKLSFF